MARLVAQAWRIQNTSHTSLVAAAPKYWQASQRAKANERVANTRLASRPIWVRYTTTPNSRSMTITTSSVMMKRFVMAGIGGR